MSTMPTDVSGPGTADSQQALLEFAVSNSPVIVYVATAVGDHAVRFISANVETITGHRPGAFTDAPGFGRSRIHPDDLAAFDRALAALPAAGTARREYRMRAADGRDQWFRDDLTLTEDGEAFVGSMVDITAEKAARGRLRDVELLNAAIIGTVQNAIVAADRGGNVVDFNAAAERIFGYTREQALGRPLAELIVPADQRAAHHAGMRRFMETGETRMMNRRVETRAVRADGTDFPVELSITHTEVDGRMLFVGEIADISERVAAEAERKRQSRLMQDAIENLPSGFAVSDAGGDIILCNTAFAEPYGRTPDSMAGVSRLDIVREISRQLRHFDGEAVACTDADVDHILARLSDVSKGPVEMELSDGRWMLVTHAPTSDGGLVVVRTDITSQKHTEQALRESEERFRHIVENHPLPVFLFHVEDGRVLYESPAVPALLRRKAARGATYSALEYFPYKSERKQFVRALRAAGEVHGFDARVRLHDGAPGWVSMTARLIQYQGRDTVIASMVDLTERKAAEEALKVSESRYRALVENAPVCIHEIDKHGRISSMNPRGMQIAGAPKLDAIIGRHYLDLIHHDDKPQVADRMAAAMAGERVEMEFRGFGDQGYFFSTKIPIRNDQGEVEKLIGVVIDITERKQQETAIRQARETLEDAIESLPDGFALWDAEDRLITCNTRFREYNPLVSDLLQPGVAWREFMRTAVQRGQFPDIGAGEAETWVERLRGELDTEGRTREFHDSAGRWFRVISSRTRQGGLVGVRSDITGFKQMEDALRDNEAMVRQVLEACPMPVLMTRLNGEIIYESPAGRNLFGRNLTSAVDSTLPAWADLAAREDYVARLRAHGVVDEYEALLRRPDGSLFPGAISARLISFKGEDVIVSSTRDLTESRAVEKEMQRQREALYQGEKLSAMGQLLASVAHELNNPLSVVVGQSLLMQETAMDPGVVERAGKIGKAADRCARIVKTFLAMARQQPVEMASVNLNDVVNTSLEVTGYALRSHDIDVVLEKADDLPPAWADADQLNQVLTNLIVNAQQALEAQPVPRRIKVRTSYEPEPKQLLLEFSDNGPGMPPEIRSRVFEPFFTTKDKGSGTGIGLTVSHRIVATHGGSIGCDSTPGRGTTFSIRLPASPSESTRSISRTEGAARAGRLDVLVVDDEPDVADVIAELLRAEDHRVEVVGSGEAALERLAARRFDLVLSDIRMPGLDGPALYAELAESNPGMAGRVAFVTGDTLSPKVRQFLEATDCPRLEKPVTLSELRELVSRFVAGRP